MDGTDGGAFAFFSEDSEAIGTGTDDGDWAKSALQNVSRISTTEKDVRKAFGLMSHFIANDDSDVSKSISS